MKSAPFLWFSLYPLSFFILLHRSPHSFIEHPHLLLLLFSSPFPQIKHIPHNSTSPLLLIPLTDPFLPFPYSYPYLPLHSLFPFSPTLHTTNIAPLLSSPSWYFTFAYPQNDLPPPPTELFVSLSPQINRISFNSPSPSPLLLTPSTDPFFPFLYSFPFLPLYFFFPFNLTTLHSTLIATHLSSSFWFLIFSTPKINSLPFLFSIYKVTPSPSDLFNHLAVTSLAPLYIFFCKYAEFKAYF